MKARKDGRYQSTKRVDGQKIFGYGATPQEAQADLATKVKELTSISESLPLELRLHDVATRLWLPRIQNLTPNTVKRYTGAYRCHIRDVLGSMPIESITRNDVQRFSNNVKGSPASVRFVIATLRNIFHEALLAELIPRNPVFSISKPKKRENRERTLELEEALSLIEHMDKTPASCPVYLAAVLGLRRGEIAGLKWEDLDRVQGRLKIVRQRQGVTKRGVVETELKTSSSRRTLTLPKSILEGIDKRGDLDHVYVCTYGNAPFVPDTIGELWNKHKPEGFEDWTFHDLRHLAAGLLYASGAGLQEIAAILGHKKPDMTLLYTAIRESQAAEALEKLGRRL